MDSITRKHIDKALQRFRENDRNVTFEEIDHLLDYMGFDRRMAGSHATYKRKGTRPITIPFRKPHILPVYVKAIIQLLEEILLNEEDASK